MARYLIRALRQLQVGDSLRQPGELVPEAVDWPNLRSYETLQWLERVPVPEDYQGEGAISYPPPAPTSRLTKILEATEREPAQVVVAGKRKAKTSVGIRCLNCRKLNHLPKDFKETASWMCWDCAQPQTIAQTREHPSPTSLAEYAESVDARYVDEQGDLLNDKWMEKGGPDVTDEWKQSVAR